MNTKKTFRDFRALAGAGAPLEDTIALMLGLREIATPSVQMRAEVARLWLEEVKMYAAGEATDDGKARVAVQPGTGDSGDAEHAPLEPDQDVDGESPEG